MSKNIIERLKSAKIKKSYLIIALLFVSFLLEILLFGYYAYVKQLYTKKHLIGNTPSIIEKDALVSSEEPDEGGYNNLSFEHFTENVYNVSLVMKETTEDAYVRLLYHSGGKVEVSLMQKADLDQRVFKTYIDGKNLERFEIIYYLDSIDINKIESVVINDNLEYVQEPEFSICRVFVFFAIFMLIYGCILLYKKISKKEIKLKKEYIFLTLGAVIGITMCFTNAVLSKYDEHTHFWRAYEITEGTILSGRSEGLPGSIFDVVINEDGVYEIEDNASYSKQKEKLKIQLNPSELSSKLVGAAAGNSPISYIPQVVGVEIGKLLKLNPLRIAIAGRITNLIVYLVVMFLSIKMMPKEKWKNFILIIGLLPMSMNIAASLSPDMTIIATLTLAISYIMKLKFGSDKIKPLDVAILAALFTIASMCKNVYLPLAFMMLLLPDKLFKNKKQKWMYLGVVLLSFIAVWTLWKIAPQQEIEITTSTSEREQLFFTLSDPLRDLQILGNTIWTNTEDYLVTMIGGWNTPIGIIAIWGIVIFIATFEDTEEKEKLKVGEKVFLLFLCLLIMFLIYIGLYILWTRAQSPIALGIQGRYFLPILLVILMIFDKDVFAFKIKNRAIKYILLTILLYIPIFVRTIQYFSK